MFALITSRTRAFQQRLPNLPIAWAGPDNCLAAYCFMSAHADMGVRDLISGRLAEGVRTSLIRTKEYEMGVGLDAYEIGDGIYNWIKDDTFDLPDTNGVTISVWYQLPVAISGSQPRLFQIGDDAAGDRLLAHAPWTDGNCYWDHGNATGGDGRVSFDMSEFGAAGPFHAVFWAEGGSGNGEGQGIQMNGVERVTDTNTATPTTTTPLYVGGGESSALWHSQSYVYDFRVYHGALPQPERMALYAPESRWSHYEWYGRKTYFIPEAAAPAAGRVMGSLVGEAGLAGAGGLAGQRGGLAA